MSLGDDQTAELQKLIDRVNQGDDAARMVLIDRAYERLRQLSALILRQSFPRLKGAPTLVDTTDVAHESAYRLYHALAEIQPTTVRDFFRLAAQRIRWICSTWPGRPIAPSMSIGSQSRATRTPPDPILPLSSPTSISRSRACPPMSGRSWT